MSQLTFAISLRPICYPPCFIDGTKILSVGSANLRATHRDLNNFA